MAFLLLLAAAAIGAALTVQVAMNTALRAYAGTPAGATLISFAVGAAAVAVFLIATRQPWPSGRALAGAPAWAWFGGVLGGTYVLVTVVLSPRLGPGPLFGAIVAGQMATALLLQQFGVLGVPQRAVTPIQLLGVALIVGGVLLIRR